MTFVTSIDKSGDLKIGKRKCKYLKKSEITKVAGLASHKSFKNLSNTEKSKKMMEIQKMTKEKQCKYIKRLAMKAGNFNRIPLAKLYQNKIPLTKQYQNNIPLAKLYQNKIPLAKLYPGAAKRIAAMKGVSPSRLVVVEKSKPPTTTKKTSRSPITAAVAMQRVNAIKALTKGNKQRLKYMISSGQTPRKVVTLARELARLK